MASLADLSGIYAPAGTESGFTLAGIDRQSSLAQGQAGIGRERVLRNYNQFDLPALMGSQAARGAFNTSATRNKKTQLATGAGDSLTDIEYGLANVMSGLSSNALLAKTGIQL